MADETADVLTQDGPKEVQDTAEASESSVKAEQAGEAKDPQASQDQGNEGEHKRLGGWQRKIQKLERELEVWRDQALKTQPTQAQPTATKRPEPPDLDTFSGTTAEFKAAQKKYAEDLEKFIDQQRSAADQQKQAETAQRTFNERLRKLPEFKEVNEAFEDLGAGKDLEQFLQVQLSTLKNGPEVMRELMLDADSREELMDLDRRKDGVGIVAMLHAVSRGLRIAQRNQADPPAQTRAPKPATPLRKSASTDSTELRDDLDVKEWMRRRNAQIAARNG